MNVSQKEAKQYTNMMCVLRVLLQTDIIWEMIGRAFASHDIEVSLVCCNGI